MKLPSLAALSVWVVIAGTAIVTAQHASPSSPSPGRKVQPLLGVGNNPPSPSTSPSAFFDDTVLHEIRLVMNSRDWQTLKDNYLDNTYYPTDFRWRDQVVRNVGIRSRGTGSRSGIKPGLRIDFDRYTSTQRFLGLKSFVLRNNTQDPSNMRERISMLLFKRLNSPAPREAHTKMFVNDQYVGLFTTVESIDKDFLNLTFGEDGGYLYKYDYPINGTPYYFEDKGSNGDAYVPLPFKPETHETDPRPEFLVQLIQAVNQSSADTFRSAVAQYMDLQRFIRHVAVEVFVGDYDGFIGNYGINNFYIYRFDNSKLFELIAWDKSEAFLAAPTSSIFHNISDVPDAQKNRLMNRALSYPELYTYFLDTLLECARSASEQIPGDGRGWMEREVSKEYAQIGDAARSDTEKPYSNDSFEQAVVGLMNFARQRPAAVTAEANASRR